MWVWLSFDSCTSILFRIQTIPDRLIENQIEDCRTQHFLAARKQPGVFDCLVYYKKMPKKWSQILATKLIAMTTLVTFWYHVPVRI